MATQSKSKEQERLDDAEETEAVELVLFHVCECYVYLIPPRKTAASYRNSRKFELQFLIFLVIELLDRWPRQVNGTSTNGVWEGTLQVISEGEECIIRLEDRTTGELYARAFLRNGELHPVEPVIDSSRYFVLRVEENIDGRLRHAFLGIGFRERTEAYDFQAALHDHMKYLNKKKTAEEMEQHYQHSSSVDYSLKEGETLVLQIKNKSGRSPKSKLFEQSMSNLSLEEKGNGKEPVICLRPPPPPAATVSPAATIQKGALDLPMSSSLKDSPKAETREASKQEANESHSREDENGEGGYS